MKKKNGFISPFPIAMGIFLAAALVFASCKKSNNDNTPVSALAISHAAPGFPAYDFRINGKLVLRRPLEFGSYLDYGFLTSGKQEFSISKTGSMEVAARASFILKQQTYYSVSIADSSGKPVFQLSEDDLSPAPAGKAKIRFVNLSPDAGSLDLSVSGSDTALFSNTGYRASTGFTVIDTASALKMEVKQAGGSVAFLSTSIKIEKNRTYTLRATGLKTAADSTKFRLTLITNK